MPVDGAAIGIADHCEKALCIVLVSDDKTGRAGFTVHPPIGVVADALDKTLAVDGGCRGICPAVLVIAVALLITVGAVDLCQFANAVGRCVVGPGGLTLGLHTTDHPSQGVVLHGDGLALGVGLADQLTDHVVPVAPDAHIGIDHAGLAATGVIGHLGEHPDAVTVVQ